MQKINLRELYPDIYKKDTYLEVTDEVQAAFYGDWGISPTSRKSLSCHESPACSRVGSKKIVQNLEGLSIDFVRFLE